MQEKKGSEKREVLLISFSISARFVFAIICRWKFLVVEFLCKFYRGFHVFCHIDGSSYHTRIVGVRNGKGSCIGIALGWSLIVIAKYAGYPWSIGNKENDCLCSTCYCYGNNIRLCIRKSFLGGLSHENINSLYR